MWKAFQLEQAIFLVRTCDFVLNRKDIFHAVSQTVKVRMNNLELGPEAMEPLQVLKMMKSLLGKLLKTAACKVDEREEALKLENPFRSRIVIM